MGQFLVKGDDGATLAQHQMKKTPEVQGFVRIRKGREAR
jgi:hypothetical protein